ncbi:MAG TPA: methionyl-tRNA formyltransferase [Acidimicrobiia bacterium]|nr:methionyl-tRNA formyltransferase [Acidimicrobiia bacterium]
MSKVRAVFLGTPAAAVPSLDYLTDAAEVSAVVTRPDRPRGRSGNPQPSPVKVAALARGLTVVEAGGADDIDGQLLDVDLAVVVAFGVIIPARALARPRHGFVNLHFSLLPRWRGAAPVAASIAAGDEETGVSLMQLDQGLDTGPVLAARSVVIGDEETAGELTTRLSHLAGSLLVDTISALLAGEIEAVAQDGAKATYAPRLGPNDRQVDLNQAAEQNVRKIRALTPKPGAYFLVDGERVAITSARATGDTLATGEFASDGEHLLVGSGGRAMELRMVRPAGKREMTGGAWSRGWRSTPHVGN